MSHHVFISYASEDRAVAEAVCKTLESSNLRCWVAPRDLLPGKEYASEIIKAISSSRALVLVFSSRANASPLVRRELERAASKGVSIVPFRIEDVQPTDSIEFFVSQHHWLDAIGPPIEAHLKTLSNAVTRLIQSSYGADPEPSYETLVATWINAGEMVGRHVGPYLIKAHKGSGGSGHVYLATEGESGRKVCVKLLHPSTAAADRIRIAVARAVRALSCVDHPSIAKVYDYGLVMLDEGVSDYVAMEWIDGKPLHMWNMEIAGRADARKLRLKVAIDLAEALSVAHTIRYVDENGFEMHGLWHGDLKPDNILVRPDGTPVLVDFMMMDVQRLLGYPRLRGRDPSSMSTGAFGTPGYMAPEQELQGIVTTQTDLYGLGVTLWPVFYPDELPHCSPQQTRRLVKKPRWRFPSPRPRADSDPLRTLLSEMTGPDPTNRPATADLVASRLRQVAGAAGTTLS